MIKILVHFPTKSVELAPGEYSVPALPRKGDSLKLQKGSYSVAEVSFHEDAVNLCSVHVYVEKIQ